MVTRDDLSYFVHSMIVGIIVLETADLLGVFNTTIPMVYNKEPKKKKLSSK